MAKRFRSGLERRNADRLRRTGHKFDYEPFKIRFTQPAKSRLYLPDFVLPNAQIIELKGQWTTADRQKFKFLLSEHPDLDVRFVFSNAHAKISKKSKTTYAMYCDKQGWRWAHKVIPFEWVTEPLNEASAAVIREALKDPVNMK